MSIKDYIEKEIVSLESKLASENDAIASTSDLVERLINLAKISINEVNSTTAVEEKIDKLTLCIQNLISEVQNTNHGIRDKVKTLNIEINSLKKVLHNINVMEEDEKKNKVASRKSTKPRSKN